MNHRNMRSTLGSFISNNAARALGVSKITDQLEELSLSDAGESSSSNVVSRRIPRSIKVDPSTMPHRAILSHMSSVCKYMQNLHAPAHLKEIINTPVVTKPLGFIDRLFEHKMTTFMGLGYRFKPGQSDFLMHDLRLPSSFKLIYKIWKESFGLSMSKKMLSVRDLCSFSHQDGIQSVLDVKYPNTFLTPNRVIHMR